MNSRSNKVTSTRLLERSLILFVTTFLMSGCDKLCSNSCPNNQIHDSFCGCFDNYGKTSPSPPAGGPGNVVGSACICGEDPNGNRAIAWFTGKPAQYGKAYGQVIHLSSSACVDLTACPIVGPNDQQIVLTGRQDIQISIWQEHSNLIYGGTSYSVEGPVQPVTSDDRAHFTPQYSEVAYTASRLSSSLVASIMDNGVSVSTSTAALDCNAECDITNPSPLCEVTSYPKNAERPLLALKAKLQQKSTKSISSGDLLKMFAQTKDDCARGSTSVEDGRLSNEGAACDISTKLDELHIDATIKIPPKLTGLITESGGGLRIVFPDSNQAARLELSDVGLNNRFGGFIKSLDAGPNAIRFSMPHGCLAISAVQGL